MLFLGWVLMFLPHGLVYGDNYFEWQNQESVMSPTGVTINRGLLIPSSNSVQITIDALAFDPITNQLRLNWVEGSIASINNRVLVVNGPLYLLKNGLMTFPQLDASQRTERSWNLQDGNLQVFFSLNWYFQQAGHDNIYEITTNWPTEPVLSPNQTNVSTLVQQFAPGPMVTSPLASSPIPLYVTNSATIQLSPSGVTRYLPYDFPISAPTAPSGVPNTMMPYRDDGNTLRMRLLTGGTTYVIKNIAYQVGVTKKEYTLMYGPYRTGARNSPQGLSDIPVLQHLIPSTNHSNGIRFDLSEWFFSPNKASPDQLIQVARPGIGLPYSVMIGGQFNTLTGGVMVKGSALVTGVLGGQFNESPSSVIDWSTGTFQRMTMGGSARSITFVDPTYNGAALPPTTLYLLVKRTGNGVLTFKQSNLSWPDANTEDDTPADRSDEWELDLVDWTKVDGNNWPLFQVYTFIYTGTHYLGAYSGLYNSQPQGNGRRF
ncbi:hypothetical protein EBZ35_04180 [bacterium]|nr:hypothetical protein [bacterium]